MLSALTLLVALSQNGAQTPTLPSFPSSWQGLVPLQNETHDGAAIATLSTPSSGQTFAATGFQLDSPPLDRELHFTVFLRRRTGNEPVTVNSFAYTSKQLQVGNGSKQVALTSGQWTKADISIVAPTGSSSLSAYIINMGKTPVDISGPNISVGAWHLTALNGSGILRASSQSVVTGGHGEVHFPIPSPYRDQASISFKLTANVPSALTSWTIQKRTADDWICIAKVSPPKNTAVLLHWESLILVRQSPPLELPKASFVPPPAEVASWLKPSPVVQSNDPGIQAKAKELKANSKDLEDFVQSVIDFTSKNEGTGQPFVALDAKSAMGCGGSCTSRANLAAALLRAAGVPARTVPHLPTWCYGEMLYEHWLTEYWHPGVGWVWIEPTEGVYQPETSTAAVLAVSTLDDELATGKSGQLAWIMPGAAWMSGIQGFGGLFGAGTEEQGNASWCKPERRLDVTSELFAAARKAWPNITGNARVAQIEKVALNGSPSDIAAVIGSGSK